MFSAVVQYFILSACTASTTNIRRGLKVTQLQQTLPYKIFFIS